MVEDISENYIEKPFLAPGTFTDFIKNAIDVVQCRCAHALLASIYSARLNIMKILHLQYTGSIKTVMTMHAG